MNVNVYRTWIDGSGDLQEESLEGDFEVIGSRPDEYPKAYIIKDEICPLSGETQVVGFFCATRADGRFEHLSEMSDVKYFCGCEEAIAYAESIGFRAP